MNVFLVILAAFGLTLLARALSANTPLPVDEGDFGSYPVLASATIYEGSMVGLSSGYARALTAGDSFVGHAVAKVVEATAVNGGADVRVRTGVYRLKVTLASVAVTDVGKPVYASDDGTYTLTASTNSLVGRVHRYVTTNTCIVEFRATQQTKQTALTTQLTTITIADAAGTPDYALQALTTSSPYGLATAAEAITLLYVIQNLQTRMSELETRLKALGMLA